MTAVVHGKGFNLIPLTGLGNVDIAGKGETAGFAAILL